MEEPGEREDRVHGGEEIRGKMGRIRVNLKVILRFHIFSHVFGFET